MLIFDLWSLIINSLPTYIYSQFWLGMTHTDWLACLLVCCQFTETSVVIRRKVWCVNEWMNVWWGWRGFSCWWCAAANNNRWQAPCVGWLSLCPVWLYSLLHYIIVASSSSPSFFPSWMCARWYVIIIQQREQPNQSAPTIYHPLETHYDSVVVVVVHPSTTHNSSSSFITSPLLNPSSSSSAPLSSYLVN